MESGQKIPESTNQKSKKNGKLNEAKIVKIEKRKIREKESGQKFQNWLQIKNELRIREIECGQKLKKLSKVS